MLKGFFQKKEDELRSKIKFQVESSLSDIKEELVDHLGTINANTNEIQSNYNHFYDLSLKVDKLNQKIEETQLMLKEISGQKDVVKQNVRLVNPLSVHEKEVFLTLYTSEDLSLSYDEIAARLNLTDSIVRQLVFNLIERRIPIIKEYKSGKAHLKLDRQFRELQAKENLLKIDQTTLEKFQFVE